MVIVQTAMKYLPQLYITQTSHRFQTRRLARSHCIVSTQCRKVKQQQQPEQKRNTFQDAERRNGLQQRSLGWRPNRHSSSHQLQLVRAREVNRKFLKLPPGRCQGPGDLPLPLSLASSRLASPGQNRRAESEQSTATEVMDSAQTEKNSKTYKRFKESVGRSVRSCVKVEVDVLGSRP